MALAVCQIREGSGNFECLNSLAAIRILGDACEILLITIIYRNIIGASIALTPQPHSMINGNHGTPVPAYTATSIDAQAVNTGEAHAQINGSEYTFGGLCA